MQVFKLLEFEEKTEFEVLIEIDKTEILAKITGDMSLIDFPAIAPNPIRKNKLWTTGCFEIFVSGKGKFYSEYNFGFCGNWQKIDFECYREIVTPHSEILISPKIISEITTESFSQKVIFGDNPICDNAFSLAVAIKLKGGKFLYFANKHCGQKPDFHLEKARILRL